MGKRKNRQVWKYYKVENDKIIKLKKTCPICGNGAYLAEHKDRYSCGKCGYTEWKTVQKLTEVPEVGIKIKV